MYRVLPWLILAAACHPAGEPERDAPIRTAPWTDRLPRSTEVWTPDHGFQPRRAVMHLHSPWSHDACDGEGLDPSGDPAGTPNEACLDDLRYGLCRTRFDFAFVTDHPDYAAWQDFDRLLLQRPGDEPIVEEGATVGFRIPCDDGHEVQWFPGNEDELMPMAFRANVPGTPEERHALLNRSDADALRAMQDAGATVMVAHTEGRDLAWLEGLQDAGLTGVELFNLHAMFAPDIREEDLGLSPFGWTEGLDVFTVNPDGTEPDLLFLAVLQHQPPSLERFDALLARGPVVGIAGTDAHQNVLNYPLADGERGDSYRRMLRWFSNVLLTEGPDRADAVAATRAGRNYVVFEALGTPVDFTVWFEAGGAEVPVGSTASGPGTLHVGCPDLAPGVPRGEDAPEVAVEVLRDGQPFATGCGDHAISEPGAYRVQVEMVPHHLRPFLGADPDRWMRSYPWIYSNAIRVE